MDKEPNEIRVFLESPRTLELASESNKSKREEEWEELDERAEEGTEDGSGERSIRGRLIKKEELRSLVSKEACDVKYEPLENVFLEKETKIIEKKGLSKSFSKNISLGPRGDLQNKGKPKSRKGTVKKSKADFYVPVKSIYEQEDLSKLTERQRILAARFHSMEGEASSLFLAVNNISEKAKGKSNIVHSRQPKKQALCKKCESDFENLKMFVNWLGDLHICTITRKIKLFAKKLQIRNECLCDPNHSFYKTVYGFLNRKCCKY